MASVLSSGRNVKQDRERRKTKKYQADGDQEAEKSKAAGGGKT